jgi:hypothetical protein
MLVIITIITLMVVMMMIMITITMMIMLVILTITMSYELARKASVYYIHIQMSVYITTDHLIGKQLRALHACRGCHYDAPPQHPSH